MNTENHNEMNILFVTDENFAEICTVAMRSVVEHNENVTIYVIQDNVKEVTLKKMKDSLHGIECNLIFINAIDIAKKYHITTEKSDWPVSCMHRLFVCDYLPITMDKILYLDCDVIVRHSLNELYETSFDDDEYCAAAADCVGSLSRKNIGIDSKSDYYNSGVMLINLDLWRKNEAKLKFMKIMEEKKGTFQYPDQDIINKVFENHIKRIDAKYNVTSYEYGYSYTELMYYHNADLFIDIDEYNRAISDPFIFHFTNDARLIRPWFKGTNHPFYREWVSVRNKTVWKDEKLRDDNGNFIVKVKRKIAFLLPRKLMLFFARRINKKHTMRYS